MSILNIRHRLIPILLILALVPSLASAQSDFDPTILVNTESELIIDDGDATTDVTLQFGNALAERLSFEQATSRFSFSDDVSVGGNLNVTGTMSGQSLLVSGTGSSSHPLIATDASTARVGIGTDTPDADFEILKNGIPEQLITGFSDSGGGQLAFKRARGTSESPDALEFGNIIGGIAGKGHDGSEFSGNRVSISFSAAEDWSDTEQGTEIRFQVTQPGTTTGIEAMRITGDGNVGINQTNPETELDVAGAMSGSALTISTLRSCDTIDTDADGNLVCGTDEGGAEASNFGSGNVIHIGDERYTKKGGDTMTGNLTIERAANTALLTLEETTGGDSISMYEGAGSPEGTVTAQLGSMYFDNFRGRIYKKHSGDGTDTGWEELAIATGAHLGRMTRDAAQFISNNTPTKIAFDNEAFDVGGIADSVTNDRFNIVNTGTYLVTASWSTAADLDNNDYMEVCIYRNGIVDTCNRNMAPGNNQVVSVEITDVLQLNADDYIEMYVEHNEGGGGGLNTNTADLVPRMSVVEITSGSSGAGGGGGDGISVGEADSRYVNVVGDTMSGTLLMDMNSDSIALDIDSEATTKATIRVDGAGTASAPHVLFGNSGVFDTNLFRSAANTLRTSDAFVIEGSLTVGSDLLKVDTAAGKVGINTGSPATELEVEGTISGSNIIALNQFQGAGLVDCDDSLNDKLLWDQTTKQFSCGTDGGGGGGSGSAGTGNALSFTDTTVDTSVSFTSATNVWDGTQPNITLGHDSGAVLVAAVIDLEADDANDTNSSFQIRRNIGADATCSSTLVGQTFRGSFLDNTGDRTHAVGIFIDYPDTLSEVRYAICTGTDGEDDGTVNTIAVSLVEVVGTNAMTESEANKKFVKTAGDTMTGALSIDQNSNQLSFEIDSLATTQPGMQINIAGDSNSPHILLGEGGAYDTNLYRGGSNLLQTDDAFTSKSVLSGSSLNVAGGKVTIASDGTAVFNEHGSAVNFRVESDGEGNMFYVDASNNRIGIHTSSPSRTLDIEDSGTVFEMGDGTASDIVMNFDDGTERNLGWDDSETAFSTFNNELIFRTRQSATPFVACSGTTAGTQWMDTDTGMIYVCDTSNGRNKWLSTQDMLLWGEQTATCGNNEDIGNEDACVAEFGTGLGSHANTPNMGFFLTDDITITGYGFSADADNCAASLDIEVWGTGDTDDDGFSLDQTVASGLNDDSHNGSGLNVDIDGNQYILWGIDNNCGGGIDDFNVILYYRWRHD